MYMSLIGRDPGVMFACSGIRNYNKFSLGNSFWVAFWDREKVYRELHLAIIVCTEDIFHHLTF